MDLQDRIHKIDKYFQLFNIAENVAYIVTQFPRNWTVPKSIENEYKVQTKYDQQKGVTYFFAELSQNPNGLESSFDAVDAVIKLNQEIEIRAKIFKEKAEQLKEIVYTESIEALNSLEFVIKQKRGRKKIQVAKQTKEDKVEKKEEIYKTEEKHNEALNNNEESDLFNEAKKMVVE